MRASGVRCVLIYCADYQCSHWTKTRGDQWRDDVRLSDIEERFICSACGKLGADSDRISIGTRNRSDIEAEK
jgi:hypothetical protein